MGHVYGQPKFGRFANGKERKTSPKTLFRQSKVWKDFRAAMIKMNNGTCECCGIRYPASKYHLLQVHHLQPDDYYNLDPAKFSVLCSSDHDMIERWVTRINGVYFEAPSIIQLWWPLIGQHISQPARQKLEDILAGKHTIPEKPKKAKAPKRTQNEI